MSLSRRDFLKGLVGGVIVLGLSNKGYGSSHPELSWREIRNTMFYGHGGINDDYKELLEYEGKKKIGERTKVVMVESLEEYERVREELRKGNDPYVIGFVYVPDRDPRGRGNKVIDEIWKEYIEKNNVPYGRELDLERSMYKRGRSPRYLPVGELLNFMKENNIKPFSFLRYLFLEGFQGKSFAEIDGLSPHVFNTYRYLQWLKEDGKEIPDKIYPMALFVMEVYDPYKRGHENVLERRVDVVYWIEPRTIKKDEHVVKEIYTWLPVLSLNIHYLTKESVSPLYVLELSHLVLSYFNYTKETTRISSESTFKAVLKPKLCRTIAKKN